LGGEVEGLFAILIPDAADQTYQSHLRRLKEAFGGRAYLALTVRRRDTSSADLRTKETPYNQWGRCRQRIEFFPPAAQRHLGFL